MLAATAGALVKLSGLAVVLGLAIDLVHRRAWRQLALSAIATAALSLLLYAPFWEGPRTLAPLLAQTSRVVWSPGTLLMFLLGWLGPASETIARDAGALACAAIITVVSRQRAALASRSSVLLLGSLLLLTTAFFAHYLVPVVALAAVAGSPRLERLVTLLSIGSLAAYSVELLGVGLPSDWIGSAGYQALGSILTLAPALCLVTGWSMTYLRQAHTPAPLTLGALRKLGA
jgi:hypothetical protein